MASTSEWRLAGSFFKHKGHNIFWREGGNPSGSVLLLIHGYSDGVLGLGENLAAPHATLSNSDAGYDRIRFL
jgi:hypothetical protein